MVKRPVVLEVPLVLDSFYLISFLQFLFPFSRKRLLLRWIVDIVKGIRSSLEELCESRCFFFCFWLLSQHLLPCHVTKMCHVCYYNSDATFRLLMVVTSIPTLDRFLLRLLVRSIDECQKLKKLSQRQHNKLAIRV